ncbi:ABC transporter permease [Nocardiopsis sp. L17-MgMaSL7]|uniref:ABC transporter permease n=1 Tax=Nocardiopsis sp. L17-MgMaSL7 TaxID=1938893 RepID=UPI000D71822D|nr:anibiotic ABC transporter efflux pump [Nocardiopsis sp. L17-MgMaSL7]PWV50131.1 ABC-2 type transport system permease protein [Nocardiopsis sp. L17-MgMaSL7]
MSALTGTWTLTRFALRRDRVRLAVWTVALAGTTAASIPALDGTFTNREERQARAQLIETPTGVVFGGPGYGVDDYTLSRMLVNELTMSLLLALAVMSVLHVVRHTRAEEESGRTELLRAGVVGSAAQTTAALLTLSLVNLVIGGLVTASMTGYGLSAADSAAYGLGLALAGITFGAIASVCAQVSEHARSASGLAFLAVGVLYMVRVVGDIEERGGTPVSWFSPFAWVQQTRPFVDLRWEPLALYGVVVLVLLAVSHVLAGRRDVGAGLVSSRPGRPEAGRLLSGTLTLHLHQQRGAILAWTAAVFAFAYAFGTLASQVREMLDGNPDLAVLLGAAGDDVVNGFLAMIGVYAVMAASAYGALSVLRAHTEEGAGRAELVLSTAVGRAQWLGAALVVAALASVLITVAGGLGLGLGASVALGEADWTWRTVVAVLSQLPAALTFGALAALLFGTAPRLLPLLWLWLAYSLVATMLGGLFHFSERVMDLSAFEILPRPPVDEFDSARFLLYLGAVLLAGSVALLGFRGRDLASN